jgi:hypothetical protein
MSWSELAVGYLLIGGLVIALPVIFFVIAFMPGLMRTSGEVIGTKQELPEWKHQPPQPVASRSTGATGVAKNRPRRAARNFANTP